MLILSYGVRTLVPAVNLTTQRQHYHQNKIRQIRTCTKLKNKNQFLLWMRYLHGKSGSSGMLASRIIYLVAFFKVHFKLPLEQYSITAVVVGANQATNTAQRRQNRFQCQYDAMMFIRPNVYRLSERWCTMWFTSTKNLQSLSSQESFVACWFLDVSLSVSHY